MPTFDVSWCPWGFILRFCVILRWWCMHGLQAKIPDVCVYMSLHVCAYFVSYLPAQHVYMHIYEY